MSETQPHSIAKTRRQLESSEGALMKATIPDKLLLDFLGGGYTPGTVRRYRSALDRWQAWCATEGLDPMAVGRPDIERFSQALPDQGLSANSTRATLTALASLYRYAFEEGYTPTDPAARLRRPKRESHSTGTWLTKAEAQAMSDLAIRDPDPRVAALYLLLLYTGARLGEALGADVDDLAPASKGVTLRVTRKTTSGGRRVQPILLHPKAAAAIDRMLGARDDGPLFLGATGHRLSHDGANRLLDHLAKGARIGKKITAHSLRRTFATLCRDAGVPDRDIMASGAWTTPGMLEYYDMERASIDRHAGIALGDWLDPSDTMEP